MLVSYLGVDSPAASSPGVLGASFSGYSGGRQRFVVDAGGWEVERVQMPGDGWRDARMPKPINGSPGRGCAGKTSACSSIIKPDAKPHFKPSGPSTDPNSYNKARNDTKCLILEDIDLDETHSRRKTQLDQRELRRKHTNYVAN